MKFSWPSLAVWLVSTSITVTLFSGLSKSMFSKLQWIQNKLACIVVSFSTCQLWKSFTSYRFDIVSHSERKCCYTVKNTYLCQLPQGYKHFCTLRLLSENLICKSAVAAVLASRGFRYPVVSVWNNIPDIICKLKTHLYKIAFGT